ncbi:MAG TPA: MarR family transcriptional regulator [Microbacterium sp.]|nr:MarR family transcriptional regulator [Microbacterium sp.]
MELPLTNRGDFDVLRTLRSSGPPYALTPRVIERGMLVSAAGLTGRLKRLEAAGWIRRTASEVDGRSVLVQLTESGLMALDRSLPGHYAFEASLLDAIDPAERAVVADVLRRLINSLEAAGRSD